MSSIPVSQHSFDVFQAIFPGNDQKVAFTGASAQSTAFALNTTIVRVTATQDCHIKFGANPTAVADGTCTFLPKGQSEHFGVTGGQKLAVIQDSAGGNLFVSEGV